MGAGDREYLDARFNGLEKLMLSETKNLKEYIGAVSSNSKEFRDNCDEKIAAVEGKLQDHKDSAEAHGAGASGRVHGNIVGWLALLAAVAAVVVPFFVAK